MTSDPNVSRESIRAFILNSGGQIYLKRLMSRTPSSAIVLGDTAPNWGVVLQGDDGDLINYPNLDSLLDDGWMID
jgi:hypothetical protein